ncbi:MAG: copper chaperone PCu(A)C [Ilumatobacteraceae bacterium]
MNHRTTALLAPVAALALTFSLAACGSDDDSASDTTSATEATTAMDDSAMDDMDDSAMDDSDMAGGEATVGDIAVTGVWMREPAEGQTRSAAYGTITNNGDSDVTLVSASVPFDATVEIHETIMGDDGSMQMQEVPEGFVVPAGGSFTLEPGGPHIMLIDIDPADITGTIDVTMVFDDGTEVTVGAPVRPLVMDMDDMDDMSGDMSGDMTETTDG